MRARFLATSYLSFADALTKILNMGAHSYTKIMIHLIWGTYRRERILDHRCRPYLKDHMIAVASDMGVAIDCMNIQMDHIHIMLELPPDIPLSDIARRLKGNTAHWINSNKLAMGNFRWQKGYAAFSVSVSQAENVRRYIAGQEKHHDRITFKEEYEQFAKRHGVYIN